MPWHECFHDKYSHSICLFLVDFESTVNIFWSCVMRLCVCLWVCGVFPKNYSMYLPHAHHFPVTPYCHRSQLKKGDKIKREKEKRERERDKEKRIMFDINYLWTWNGRAAYSATKNSIFVVAIVVAFVSIPKQKKRERECVTKKNITN